MPALTNSVQDLLHLFFPHVCAGCGSDVLPNTHLLCLHCLSDLPDTHFFSQPGNPVEQKFYGRLALQNGASGYFFTKNSLLETLVYELKYRGNKDIGVYLGQLLGNSLLASGRFASVDVMVPLPLNPRREKKRGYNQATSLCNGIAKAFNKSVVANAVIRKVYTDTQTHKGRVSRWQNMDGVFAISNPTALRDKHVLLIDDVVTTGASLEACGSEILKVPGASLSIATLGCTI